MVRVGHDPRAVDAAGEVPDSRRVRAGGRWRSAARKLTASPTPNASRDQPTCRSNRTRLARSAHTGSRRGASRTMRTRSRWFSLLVSGPLRVVLVVLTRRRYEIGATPSKGRPRFACAPMLPPLRRLLETGPCRPGAVRTAPPKELNRCLDRRHIDMPKRAWICRASTAEQRLWRPDETGHPIQGRPFPTSTAVCSDESGCWRCGWRMDAAAQPSAG
jgi:hypothetical protein